jgi:hypothetical protein
MNVNCSAEPCPVLLDSACVFYTGGNLLYTGIVTNDSLQVALEKIDAKFQDAAIGYVFQNGIVQSTPGSPVKLGGSLNQNTTINSSGFTFTISGDLIAGKHITTGGTNSQFVKGDGTLDSTSYQPVGSYITALAGDGTATGPGLSIFTLNNVNTFPGTYGNATTVPVVTVNAKGLVTNVSTVPITFPVGSLIFTGDVTGIGTTGTNTVLTLLNVNSNVYPSNTFLKFAVNAKGLVTSAAPITNLDVEGALGYVPVPNTRTITINGVTQNLSNNRTWTVTSATAWGSITGTITAQTDLITYLSTNYTPQARTLTINGTTYDLSANRSWTIAAGVSNVTASSPITSSGGATPNISTSMNTNKLIGRGTAGVGVFEEITLGTGLSLSGTTLNATAVVTPAALTRINDTNVTLTLTGSPNTALLQAVGLTLGWTGTLADSRITSAATWNAKQDAITLTTTGTSGPATFIGNTLNIPQYSYTSPLTTKGDIFVRSTVDDRLPVGTNGQILMADSSTSTGLKWIPNTATSITNTIASGTDTYTATVPGIAAYTDGEALLVRFTNGNTTGCTLNINGLGAITLYRNNDGPLIGGDIQAGAEMLCVYNSTTPSFQCIGISPNSLFAYVTNDDSVTLTKGMPVYAFSGTGDRMTVKRANNTTDATSAQTVGLVYSASIAANQRGFIILYILDLQLDLLQM